MELLARKCARYFYILLLIVMLIQLSDAVFMTFADGRNIMACMIIVLSIVNIILLGNLIKFNIKQQFEECKAASKILRITVIPLFVLHTLCIGWDLEWIALRNCILSIATVEIILSYRINTIRYLEQLAYQFERENGMIGGEPSARRRHD